MKKLIKLDFDNTTRERKTENSYSELYSHDKNNGLFEFEILNDTLTTEQVIALFKFTESNKIWKTTGTVEGNKVKVTFDTSLITQNETVICYLYFDEEQRTSDTFRFKFKVKVSEIDKMNRYEVKERFINNTVIVDRLDVVTKDELKEALKNVGGIATEGLLTEAKAEELFVKKTDAVDNTNFELVKNRVLALELKTDKDTVYDDSELKGRISVLEAREDNNTIYDDTNVRERLTALESKPNVDVNSLVTKDELASKNYLTEHQDTSNFALKSEIPQQYNDTEVKERLTTLENKPPVDLSGYATKEELRNVSGSQPLADNLVTKEELENKHYISDISNLATKEELNEVRNNQPTVDTSHLVTKDELTAKNYLTEHQSLDNLVTKQELEEKHYLTTHQDLSEYAKKSELYNDSDLKARVEVLEQKTDKDTVYDDTLLKERVTTLESKAIEGGAYDDSDLRNRVVALETKEDKDTKYDDTEVKHRLTELENKPTVDTSVFVTEEKLSEKGYLTSHQDLTPYALKSEIPTPYNDTPLTERVTALESRPTTGGSVDTSNLVTKEELANSIPVSLYETYSTNTLKETLDEDIDLLVSPRNVAKNAGKIYVKKLTFIPKVFKGDIGNEKTVDLDTVMYSVANSLPDGYTLSDVEDDINNKVLFLSNKNFSEVVPKEELKAIVKEVGGNTGSNIDTSNLVTKDELASKNYLTEHQPLTALNDRVTALETKQDNDTVYNDSELRERVTNLENKPNVDLTNYVTNEQLENKHYLTQHQPLDNLVTKEELNSKGYVTDEVLNSKGYLTEHQNISHLVTNDELTSKGYITEEVLNGKNYLTEDVLNTKNYLTQHQDLSSLVTKQELENKHFLMEHQTLTHLATTSDLEALRNITVSKSELSKKLDTTEFNSFKDNVVTKTELAEKGYISDLSNYVTKQELHEATEIDYSNIVTTDELEPYAKKSELPTPYNDSALVSRVTALESKTNTNQPLPANQWEIHGTGMPNGVVEAEIGTTYVDKNKTNGALKWIKTTAGGNQGWEVLIGDTGWRTLNSISKLKVGDKTSYIKIRRVNNLVTYQFGGLMWGWFGIIRRNGPGYAKHNSSGDKGAKVLYPGGIPEGFRSETSLVGPTYDDKGRPYGIWYLGGKTDSNFIQFTFNEDIPTDRDIGDIRVSAISYLTEEPWPTQLP